MDQSINEGTPNPIAPPQQQVQAPGIGDTQSSKKKTLLLFVIFVLILVGIGVFVVLNLVINNQPPSVGPVPTPTAVISNVPIEEEEFFEVVLEKNVKKDINFNNIFLTYISSEIPGDTCFDCISSTFLQAELNGDIKDILYECGGITGECIVRQDVYGIGLELVQQVDQDTVRMKVHYKK